MTPVSAAFLTHRLLTPEEAQALAHLDVAERLAEAGAQPAARDEYATAQQLVRRMPSPPREVAQALENPTFAATRRSLRPAVARGRPPLPPRPGRGCRAAPPAPRQAPPLPSTPAPASASASGRAPGAGRIAPPGRPRPSRLPANVDDLPLVPLAPHEAASDAALFLTPIGRAETPAVPPRRLPRPWDGVPVAVPSKPRTGGRRPRCDVQLAGQLPSRAPSWADRLAHLFLPPTDADCPHELPHDSL